MMCAGMGRMTVVRSWWNWAQELPTNCQMIHRPMCWTRDWLLLSKILETRTQKVDLYKELFRDWARPYVVTHRGRPRTNMDTLRGYASLSIAVITPLSLASSNGSIYWKSSCFVQFWFRRQTLSSRNFVNLEFGGAFIGVDTRWDTIFLCTSITVGHTTIGTSHTQFITHVLGYLVKIKGLF